jgi:hypothetical protein
MSKLPKFVIAVDVDGTLRCNCTPTCIDPNYEIVQLVQILGRFKNVRLMVWSGGGKEYAANIIARYGLLRCFPASKLDQTTWVYGKPHITIDDQHSMTIGDINLIVRTK